MPRCTQLCAPKAPLCLSSPLFHLRSRRKLHQLKHLLLSCWQSCSPCSSGFPVSPRPSPMLRVRVRHCRAGDRPRRASRAVSTRPVRKRCLINPNSDFLLQSVGVVFFKNAAETGEETELAEISGSWGARRAGRQLRQPTHTHTCAGTRRGCQHLKAINGNIWGGKSSPTFNPTPKRTERPR